MCRFSSGTCTHHVQWVSGGSIESFVGHSVTQNLWSAINCLNREYFWQSVTPRFKRQVTRISLQAVTLAASAPMDGTVTCSYAGATTGPFMVNASAATVEAALEGQ